MHAEIARALEQIPCGRFLLTAAYSDARSGVVIDWVQQCAAAPPMVVVALSTGLPVVPLIRDSRSFALCQISEDDRFLCRKFATAPGHGEDPFVTLPTMRAPSGAPVVSRALSFLDCEVVRHVDLESDFGLYVGQVHAAAILNGGRPFRTPAPRPASASHDRTRPR